MRYADVAVVYQAAAAREAAKDWAGAVEVYRPLFGDPRSDVAQDASWRGARALWATGSSAGAMAVVEAGLARSGSPSVYRVHLLLLKGDLQNAMGRSADAAAAWAEAARLNKGR